MAQVDPVRAANTREWLLRAAQGRSRPQLSRLERRVAWLKRRQKANRQSDSLAKPTRTWSPGRTARLSRRARRRRSSA